MTPILKSLHKLLGYAGRYNDPYRIAYRLTGCCSSLMYSVLLTGLNKHLCYGYITNFILIDRILAEDISKIVTPPKQP